MKEYIGYNSKKDILKANEYLENRKKIILDLCGGTGSWSKPYKDAGYDVRVITLPKFDIGKFYTTGGLASSEKIHRPDETLCFPREDCDEAIIMAIDKENVYGILAAPPCEQFAFVRTTPKIPRDLKLGMECVASCLEIIWSCQFNYKNQHQKFSPLKFWALENPYFASTKWFLGKPAFVFQPYEFGDGYKKRTALWGYFNEPKKQEKWVMKNDKKFDVLLMSEIKALKSPVNEDAGNPKTRKELRAITPEGFAKAFFEANS